MTPEHYCRTCTYFDARRVEGLYWMGNGLGLCRRYAPEITKNSADNFHTGRWPIVKPDDFCGEWKVT